MTKGAVLNSARKILSLADVGHWRDALRNRDIPLVVTNGCFDLLHAGHVTYLESARNLGGALLVGLNSDFSVRALKGPTRPLNTENDRAIVIAALECVDGVAIFTETRADRFLQLVQPDIYVKGGDYTLETLDQTERRTVESAGGRIVILPLVPGKSTTSLINKIAQ
jgi:D-glycero-beta-D-manno-heptose 1-phosphate adenylyltransferase